MFPQFNNDLYKFKIGDTVWVDASPATRKHRGYKNSLHYSKSFFVYN